MCFQIRAEDGTCAAEFDTLSEAWEWLHKSEVVHPQAETICELWDCTRLNRAKLIAAINTEGLGDATFAPVVAHDPDTRGLDMGIVDRLSSRR